jgi:uncharacterized repeat protein (TIGR03803 family)
MQRSGFTKIAIAAVFCVAAVVPSPAQTFTTLVNFDGSNGSVTFNSLVQGVDGSLYGTPGGGGAGGKGAVFSMTPSGTLTTLHSFYGKDGNNPEGLVLATNGDFYGTTAYGGVTGAGALYKITPQGYLTSLNTFEVIGHPSGPLILAVDGNFYGTSVDGDGNGDVFKGTESGALSTLYNFCSLPNCADGYLPRALMQGSDGNLYGTTLGGGANQYYGTIYKLTPAGTLTTLYNFCSRPHCADGYEGANLIQAADGNVYGTTQYTGIETLGGTVFRFTPGHLLTTLYRFCSLPNCADGEEPVSLLQATDGNFYGTTNAGGGNKACPNTSGCGTVFKMTPAGVLTTLHSFEGADGQFPSGLLQATDGNLYGTTQNGGAKGDGTIFRISLGLEPFVSLVRGSGKVGQSAVILGQGFTGTTGVFFNGTSASFIVESDTEIEATVPAGSTTGSVTVATPGGTLTSGTIFRVEP